MASAAAGAMWAHTVIIGATTLPNGLQAAGFFLGAGVGAVTPQNYREVLPIRILGSAIGGSSQRYDFAFAYLGSSLATAITRIEVEDSNGIVRTLSQGAAHFQNRFFDTSQLESVWTWGLGSGADPVWRPSDVGKPRRLRIIWPF